MATISSGLTTSGNTGSSTTRSTGSITLLENCLMICDVLTHNTTPANLEKPTLAGTGGETWTELATETNGNPSPTLRLTRFATMVAADTTSNVTATHTLTQTNISVFVTWHGGVNTSGSNGSGAIGTTITSNSANTNITSKTVNLSAPSNPRNGYCAFMRAGSGATGSRTGWSELYDAAPNASHQVQIQTIGIPDTAWSATMGSSTVGVIITELVAVTDPVVIAQVQARSTAAISSSTNSFTFTAQDNCTYLIIAIGSTSITGFTPATPGQTWALLYHPAQASNGTEFYVYATRITTAGDYTVQISGMAAGGGNGSWGTLEVKCSIENYPPHGIVQSDTHAHNSGGAATVTFSTAAPITRNSGMFWYQANGNTSRLSQDGWQNCPTFSNSSQGGGSFRANGATTVSMTWSTGLGVNPLQSYFAEFEGIPTPSAPEVTMVSPAAGAISTSDDVVVDVTDVDEDIISWVPYFSIDSGTPELAWDGSDFTTDYIFGSSVTPITNGFRYTFSRAGGWPGTTVDFVGTAVDETGLSDVASRSWTTDYVVITPEITSEGIPSSVVIGTASILITESPLLTPHGIESNVAIGTSSILFTEITNPPVIEIVSPLPVGTSIGRTTPIVVRITDSDSAFRRILPVIKFPNIGRTELVHDGDAFTGTFSGSSRITITDGFQYTLNYSGGWPDSAITLIPFAIDVDGNENS